MYVRKVCAQGWGWGGNAAEGTDPHDDKICSYRYCAVHREFWHIGFTEPLQSNYGEWDKKMLVMRMKTAHGKRLRLVQDLRSRETSCPRSYKIIGLVKHISRPWLALDQELISSGGGGIVRWHKSGRNVFPTTDSCAATPSCAPEKGKEKGKKTRLVAG